MTVYTFNLIGTTDDLLVTLLCSVSAMNAQTVFHETVAAPSINHPTNARNSKHSNLLLGKILSLEKIKFEQELNFSQQNLGNKASVPANTH